MNPNLKPHTAHAQGLANIFLTINHKVLGQHMQDLLVRRNTHRGCGLNHSVHVGLGDFLFFNSDHAA